MKKIIKGAALEWHTDIKNDRPNPHTPFLVAYRYENTYLYPDHVCFIAGLLVSHDQAIPFEDDEDVIVLGWSYLKAPGLL